MVNRERSRDHPVVMASGVMVDPHHPRRRLPQPNRPELIQQSFVASGNAIRRSRSTWNMFTASRPTDAAAELRTPQVATPCAPKPLRESHRLIRVVTHQRVVIRRPDTSPPTPQQQTARSSAPSTAPTPPSDPARERPSRSLCSTAATVASLRSPTSSPITYFASHAQAPTARPESTHAARSSGSTSLILSRRPPRSNAAADTTTAEAATAAPPASPGQPTQVDPESPDARQSSDVRA